MITITNIMNLRYKLFNLLFEFVSQQDNKIVDLLAKLYLRNVMSHD